MTVNKNKATIGIVIAIAASVMLMINLIAITQSGLGNGSSATWDRNFQSFADNLVSDCSTDQEKVDVFANWITTNIEYDDDYNFGFYQHTNINNVIKNKTGVCFDYSNLFAAMCRSQNIPCHIVDGTSQISNTHHSWNRVLINGEWKEVDLTNDAAYFQKGEGQYFGYQPIDDSNSVYKITKIY